MFNQLAEWNVTGGLAVANCLLGCPGLKPETPFYSPSLVASRIARQTCPLLKTHPWLVKRYLVDRNLWKFDIDPNLENYRAFGFSVVAKTISNRNMTIGQKSYEDFFLKNGKLDFLSFAWKI